MPVREVSDVTGFPGDARRPREDHSSEGRRRHPRHARATPSTCARSPSTGFRAIDMVVVNLYAFEKVAAQDGRQRRRADREHRYRRTDDDPRRRQELPGRGRGRLARRLRRHSRRTAAPAAALSLDTHWQLAQQGVRAPPRHYDRAITRAPGAHCVDEGSSRRAAELLPDVLDIHARAVADAALRRESAPAGGAVLATASAGIAGAEQLHGKELSYNNLVDLDAAWQLIAGVRAARPRRSSSTPIRAAAPSGDTLAESYRKALECDPVSAFGGVLAFNRAVDDETAREVAKTFIEAIAAPDYSSGGAGDPDGEEESAAAASRARGAGRGWW